MIIKMFRPTCKDSTVTTPSAALLIEFLGAKIFGSIALTTGQFRAIQNLYGFVQEKPNKKPDSPKPPNREDFSADWEYRSAAQEYERILKLHEKWEDPKDFLQAGSDRNAMRYAEADGLRIIAWLAKYIPAGEDPLKHVIQFAVEAGLSVNSEDVDWANSNEDIDSE